MSSLTSDEILNAMKLGATLRFRSKNHSNATRRLLIYGQKEKRMDGSTYHTFIADYQKLLNNRAWYEPGNVFIIEWSWRATDDEFNKKINEPLVADAIALTNNKEHEHVFLTGNPDQCFYCGQTKWSLGIKTS